MRLANVLRTIRLRPLPITFAFVLVPLLLFLGLAPNPVITPLLPPVFRNDDKLLHSTAFATLACILVWSWDWLDRPLGARDVDVEAEPSSLANLSRAGGVDRSMRQESRSSSIERILRQQATRANDPAARSASTSRTNSYREGRPRSRPERPTPAADADNATAELEFDVEADESAEAPLVARPASETESAVAAPRRFSFLALWRDYLDWSAPSHMHLQPYILRVVINTVAMLLAAVLSEFFQDFASPYRQFDAQDIVANIYGVGVGVPVALAVETVWAPVGRWAARHM